MSHARVSAVVAVLIAGLIFVAVAFAEYTTHHWAGNGYYLASGQNGFLNSKVSLAESWGSGENRAVCAGIREIGDTCVGRGATAYYHTVNWIHVWSEPYLHNHDTEGGFFNGWYWGE